MKINGKLVTKLELDGKEIPYLHMGDKLVYSNKNASGSWDYPRQNGLAYFMANTFCDDLYTFTSWENSEMTKIWISSTVLKFDNYSNTLNGVTVSILDGYLEMSGVRESGYNFPIYNGVLPAGDYHIEFVGVRNNMQIRVNSTIGSALGKGTINYTSDGNTAVTIYVKAASNNEVSTSGVIVVKPAEYISLEINVPTDYAYRNIAPECNMHTYDGITVLVPNIACKANIEYRTT